MASYFPQCLFGFLFLTSPAYEQCLSQCQRLNSTPTPEFEPFRASAPVGQTPVLKLKLPCAALVLHDYLCLVGAAGMSVNIGQL